MKLRSGHVKADDKSRVTKRKSPAPRTPLAAIEQTFKRKKFRWTEKRDRTLLIHLIGLGGAITDEEYAKLATLWEGATADDVHARVEFLRAQQILIIRTEETAEAAAEAYPESARADNVDQSANVEESVSEETSSPRSPSPSLDHEALSPPPPSPTSPSSPSSATSDDEDDDDDDNSDEAQPALKPALKSRGTTTAIPGSKSVRFTSPIIATVREFPYPPKLDGQKTVPRKTGDQKRGNHWVPVENAPWEDEMFSAEDASDSASTSSSSRRRKRTAADDDDNDNEEEETEVPYPLSQTARSPRVPRTRVGCRLTASNVRFTDDMSPDSPRSFHNSSVAWPKPVRAMAAIVESQEWQEESEDEGETAAISRKKRFELRDVPDSFRPRWRGDKYHFPRVEFAGGAPVPAASVQPDWGWYEPDEPDHGGSWEFEEGEGESEEEDYSVEDGDVDDMVAEAEGLVGEWERSFQLAQPAYDNAQSSWGYQQVGGGVVPAPFSGEQSAGPEYGNSAGAWYPSWYPSEAPQEELVDDGSAGQQYTYPPPPVDDGGNTPYPGIGSASPAWVGEDEVAEHPQQQQQFVEESEEVEERDADDDDEWSYFNQWDYASIWPTSP